GGHDPIARHYDIWHWDGEAWHDQGNHLQNDQHTKGPVAHDEIRQRTWMLTHGSYGRWNMEGWNGTDLVGVFWTLGYTDQAADAAMAYDSDRGVCVVFGRGWTDQTLEFGSDLRITQQPLDQVVAPGDALTLTVTATGTGPIYYAWHKDGEALVDDGRITGSTTATLTIDPVEPGDAGSYHVVVRSDCGPIDSELATIITCVGDVNGDGSIGQPDLGILLANYDTTDATYQDGDLDLDGDVDQADLGLLLAVYDTDCP
ncbi:MAG: immunoglobulin domain-containing protein, partial [Phycisphaerales bacterium JB038]